MAYGFFTEHPIKGRDKSTAVPGHMLLLTAVYFYPLLFLLLSLFSFPPSPSYGLLVWLGLFLMGSSD
jgi:polyferredoxin